MSDTVLWHPTTKAMWGSLNLCPMLTMFQVCAITQSQLSALSQTGAWGEVKKCRWDMAFLMIAPSANTGGNPFFGLAAVWAHPHQGCQTTLVEATQKLLLLADDSPDWPCTFVYMSDTMLHMPLSNIRHIGAMTYGMCTANACGWLHQLQKWKWLQHGTSVVFPEGLNRVPIAHQFSFQEMSVWSATSEDGTTQDLPMLEVVLCSMESKTTGLTQVPSPFLAVEPPRRRLPSAALGAPPPTSVEYPLSLKGMDSATPEAMTTSSQASSGEATPEHDPNTIPDSHSPSPHAASKFQMQPASPPHPILIPPASV